VADTGQGIPDSLRPQLFQAFSQAPGTTREGGTGLGLHISRQLAELMGGRIEFSSEPGKGSRFVFEAPFPLGNGHPKDSTFASPRAESARVASPAATEGPAVLIVEDHPMNRKVLEGMLALRGILPDAAENGVAALEACSRRSYDLILMDRHMPEMDGIECTRRLRTLQSAEAGGNGRRAVIVGVTADAMPGSRERCLEAGMDAMITKPILDRDLEEILTRWLGPSRDRGPDGPAEGDASAGGGEAETEWVDRSQLEEMNRWVRLHKPGFWQQAQEQFEESYRRQTQTIAAACSKGRFREAGEAAHSLKGVCLMLGLRHLGGKDTQRQRTIVVLHLGADRHQLMLEADMSDR
jgi:CheY-like chemotaxis protein/HPt (histidine-containing phosphotransfer) domain-containing protein